MSTKTKTIRYAVRRAPGLDITLPASHTPKALDTLQIDSFLSTASDRLYELAVCQAEVAKEERGFSPEKSMVEGALEDGGLSTVIEHVRGQLLTTHEDRRELVRELTNAVESLLGYVPAVSQGTTCNMKYVRSLIRRGRRDGKRKGAA